MSKRTSKKRKDAPVDSDEEDAETSSAQPKELTKQQKMNVLHKCIPHASILLTKQGVSFSREAQNNIWNDIAKQCETEGIDVGDEMKLKNTVRNWFNCVSVSLHHRNEFVIYSQIMNNF